MGESEGKSITVKNSGVPVREYLVIEKHASRGTKMLLKGKGRKRPSNPPGKRQTPEAAIRAQAIRKILKNKNWRYGQTASLEFCKAMQKARWETGWPLPEPQSYVDAWTEIDPDLRRRYHQRISKEVKRALQ